LINTDERKKKMIFDRHRQLAICKRSFEDR